MMAALLLLAGVAAAVCIAIAMLDRWRRRVLRRCLADTCALLDEREIRYWADFGTLLGLIREGDLILGDKDADLCVLADELPRIAELRTPFAARRYRLLLGAGALGRLARVEDLRSPFFVDIYPYDTDGETLRSRVRPVHEDVPRRLVSDLSRLAWRGMAIAIPKQARLLLVYRYGGRYLVPCRQDKGRSAPYSLPQALWEELHSLLVVLGWLLAVPFKALRKDR